eukprot:965735-Prymnesium_polylepis.1
MRAHILQGLPAGTHALVDSLEEAHELPASANILPELRIRCTLLKITHAPHTPSDGKHRKANDEQHSNPNSFERSRRDEQRLLLAVRTRLDPLHSGVSVVAAAGQHGVSLGGLSFAWVGLACLTGWARSVEFGAS